MRLDFLVLDLVRNYLVSSSVEAHILSIIIRNSMARDIAQPLEAKTHKQISKEIIPIQWPV